MDLAKAGLSALGGVAGAAGKAGGVSAAAGPSFSEVLKGMVSEAVQAQHKAADLTAAAASGAPVAVQDVVQAINAAELTLQTLVSVRDKAVEAYQEIMRMPV